MQPRSSQESSPQPLPDHVQEQIWTFVRSEIRKQEDHSGAKVARYEIRITEVGQIEVEVTETQDPVAAAVAGGLEEAVNRLDQREDLSEEIAAGESK